MCLYAGRDLESLCSDIIIYNIYMCIYAGRDPESLQFWTAKAIVGSKINFFADPGIAPVLKDYISDVYRLFSVCGYCNTAKPYIQSGK